MNVLLGSIHRSAGSGFSEAALLEILHTFFPGRAESLQAQEPLCCCFLRDGVIVGRATDGPVTLAFIGTICRPLPSEGLANPLDDADITAAYLLQRYLKLGNKFLDQIHGTYGLVLGDSAAGRVLLAADPVGGRTLYVHSGSDEILFSSNLYSVAQALGSRLEIDRSFEDFFLIHGFYPFGRTPYTGVKSIPPGRILEYQQGAISEHPIQFGNPWAGRIEAADMVGAPEQTIIDTLYDAFMQALEEQSSSAENAAVLLGGFDSALVASALHRMGKKVTTYSFRYEDASFNQPHTDTLSDFLGTTHKWVPIAQDMIENGLKTFPTIFNQPTNWPNYVIQTDMVCRQMRNEGFRYVYSGDGCDAAFLGYPGTYQRARVYDALPALPRPVLNALLYLVGWKGLDRRLGHPYRVAMNILRALGRRSPTRGYLTFRVMDELSLAQLRLDSPPTQEMPYDDLAKALSEPFRGLPILRLAYQGKAAVSPNRNKIVGSSDDNGLGIFAPYMHAGLKAFAIGLPETVMRPKERTASQVTGKYILMKMAVDKGLLPDSIIYQRKMAAVDAPIDAWYAGPMRPLLHRICEGLPFSYDREYLDRMMDEKASEKLFKRHLMTDKVISHAVSLIVTYASFCSVSRA